VIIETIKKVLDGSTNPFLALSNSGESVVIKALLEPRMGKILFNEYISGSLANQIGLPWPQTFLATLSPSSMEWLQGQSIQVVSPDCVATNFIDNLISIPWPKPPEPYSHWNMDNLDQFPEINKNHLINYFDDPKNQSPFYGRALFELWLFFQDTKYDTLFSRLDKTPIFLDGSHALGGSDWDFQELDYTKPKCLPQSPYLEGVLTNRELYIEWFQRIESIGNDYVRSKLDAVPASWRILQEQLDFVFDLLTVKRRNFLGFWRHELLEDRYGEQTS